MSEEEYQSFLDEATHRVMSVWNEKNGSDLDDTEIGFDLNDHLNGFFRSMKDV